MTWIWLKGSHSAQELTLITSSTGTMQVGKPLMSGLYESITTERLTIRPYTSEDSTAYWRMSIRNKEHLVRYEADNPVMSISSHEDAIEILQDFATELKKGMHMFLGVFIRSTSDFVAQIYIGRTQENPLKFHIGYFVDAAHEGYGYVTEAVRAVISVLFEKMNASIIGSECDDGNLRSRAVLERCGFEIVEHLKMNKSWPDGGMTGTMKFSLPRASFMKLKEKWLNLPP